MPNSNTNAFTMKHSHDPALVWGGTRQAPTLLEGLTMLAQFCLTPGDGHISIHSCCSLALGEVGEKPPGEEE